MILSYHFEYRSNIISGKWYVHPTHLRIRLQHECIGTTYNIGSISKKR
jgi:hypothetical protein